MSKETESVLVTGNFNVLHLGHIRLLKFAKSFGKKLIVGIFSDQLAGNAVNVPLEHRLEAVAAIGFVDEVSSITTSLKDFILSHKPDVIVKGKEFEARNNPELHIIEQFGGRLIFSSGEVGTTFDGLEEKGLNIPSSAKTKIEQFMRKHKITVSRLEGLIDDFANKRICILGDIIIDEYIDCFALGMSQEEPTLVVTPNERKQFLGGAGIVASHASELGSNVKFLSVGGLDYNRNFAAKTLENYNVDYSFVIDNTRPTTLKQRFRSQGKSLLRVSTLSQQAIPNNLQELVLSEFEKEASTFDAVIFSDFNYGCLPQPLVDEIIKLAKKYNCFIAADSQSSSQTGDISRFRGADLITPTEREARLAIQNFDDGLVVLADKVMEKSQAKLALLKLGSEGILGQYADKSEIMPYTERLDALNPQAVDASGAGDSVLITASLALASGANLWEASLLGSIAAFIQVGRVGNTPIKKSELLAIIS